MSVVVRMALAVVTVAGGVVVASQEPGKPLRTIKDGLLDEIAIYGVMPTPRTVAIAVRPFSAKDADLAAGGQKGELPKETKDLQDRGPRLLLGGLVDTLKELDAFVKVTAIDAVSPAPAEALLIDGKFTRIDPGSRAKRYFVGFGAGKSSVAVTGSVKAADGTLLATFSQKRIGVMGIAGGDSTDKLQSDATSIGKDIAEFLAGWATGKKLK
jgi:hypothetical protein